MVSPDPHGRQHVLALPPGLLLTFLPMYSLQRHQLVRPVELQHLLYIYICIQAIFVLLATWNWVPLVRGKSWIIYIYIYIQYAGVKFENKHDTITVSSTRIYQEHQTCLILFISLNTQVLEAHTITLVKLILGKQTFTK